MCVVLQKLNPNYNNNWKHILFNINLKLFIVFIINKIQTIKKSQNANSLYTH